MITAGWLGVKEFESAVLGMAQRFDMAARAAVADVAGKIERRAKELSSGRPGPNVVTGSHRRGIVTNPIRREGALLWKTEVGPTMQYSRRIELGYRGTDALGRSYAQPAYPYFEPAYQDVEPEMVATFQAHMAAAI